MTVGSASGRERDRLHVVHVPGTIPAKYGAGERFLAAVARECSARGHRFTCIWGSPPQEDSVLARLTEAGAGALVMPDGGHPIRLLAPLARWLRRERADVLHSHFGPSSLVALAAALLARTPLPVY